MTWIERNLRVLKITAAASAAIAATIVFYLVVVIHGRTISPKRYQLALMFLPWGVYFGSFLPLLYHGWFAKPSDSQAGAILKLIERVFFWLVVACTVFMFFMLYAKFVF
jgi:hypothetical protein